MTSRFDNTVKMQEVNSSTISSIGYDDFMNNLRVRFKNGSLYDYVNVPFVEFESLVNAESVGKYFASAIKNKFEYIRIGWFD